MWKALGSGNTLTVDDDGAVQEGKVKTFSPPPLLSNIKLLSKLSFAVNREECL